MVAGCLASWLLVALVAPGLTTRELPFGALGPLAAVVATWAVVVRAHRLDPAGVTPILIKAFVAKAVFFGLYVTLMLAVVGLDPVRFVVSFSAYFLLLYAAQAVMLQRLFTGALHAAR
jgi:hypothetical protein